jgi:hypothetical protein
MSTNKLPKSIQAAVNRNAFRIAKTQAYEALRVALEQRARASMKTPDASVPAAILILESSQDWEVLISSVAGPVHTYVLDDVTQTRNGAMIGAMEACAKVQNL